MKQIQISINFYIFHKNINGNYLTFGDRAESHNGMEIIGNSKEIGLNKEDLKGIRNFFKDKGCQTKLYKLHNLIGEECEEAYFLLVKNGCDVLIDTNSLLEE